MANISLKGIKKIYPNGITAVQDLSLEIEDKEFVILVGPSGCGKSTALRMIAGLEEVTEGELFIDNVFANSIEPIDRDIAMVFQNYALYPDMTVYQNIAAGLKAKKVSSNEIHERVLEAAKTLKVEQLLDRMPCSLSSGQQQRVAMGRALVKRPKVFLMDEPLSNLDAKLRIKVRMELAKLHKKLQTTVIYVTHDYVEAMALGTRLVVMRDGIIQQVDTPINLYTKPKNKFVAGFFGAPSMNFIEGIVSPVDQGLELLFGNQRIQLPKSKESLLLEKGYLNKEIIMGIRPENIHNSQIFLEASKGSIVKATVEAIEILGAEAYLYLNAEDFDITAKVDVRALANEGDTIHIGLDLNKIHFFDKDTEDSISN
ncbi:MAG: sugar ABC transporter ATP-binding protein [Firmicutes bacterium HGW-Firmicutes-1]|jgi:multiple sugar transport system ATP-binding protein|nr:MAG: sugar ABC transporter ATP-binding protein [Firmicutes bacterium HGW-Firmicutes-1]